jgi:uroporphyrinogen-III synthase
MASRQHTGAAAVLVTRPSGEAADALCAALQAAGYKTFHQPLIELHGLSHPGPEQRQHLLDLDRYQRVIFISGNAVRFGMRWVEDFWPQLPEGLHWYAVGAATAAALERFGINVSTPGHNMSSEGLLAIPSLQAVRGERVLLVKGEGGRDALRQELTRRGAAVDELACYRRSVPRLPEGELAAMLDRWAIDVILVSSGEGLGNLPLLLSPAESTKLKAIGMIVPSLRVAAMARDAGFSHIITAENASDAAMIDALRHWQRRVEE